MFLVHPYDNGCFMGLQHHILVEKKKKKNIGSWINVNKEFVGG